MLQPEVGVYPAGDDSHIIHASQIPAGTPIPQGPHGPMVPTPRPSSFPVTQTPNAPQIIQNMGSSPVGFTTPSPRGGFGPTSLQGASQQGGPGNYNPPLEKSPAPRPGAPGSGQQLIKKFLLQQQQAQKQQGVNLQQLLHQQQQNIDQRQGQQSGNPQKPLGFPTLFAGSSKENDSQVKKGKGRKSRNFIIWPFFAQESESVESIRRQDVADLALDTLSKGLAPMSIFSNLLNAYATLDSKHDITGQIMKTASQLFSNPDGSPVRIPKDDFF